jgi:hypothetical protein
MSPQELREAQKRRPFEPFRIVLADGQSYDIRHPEMLWVGQWSFHVGFTSDTEQTLFERAIEIDLHHVLRIEPLQAAPSSGTGASRP